MPESGCKIKVVLITKYVNNGFVVKMETALVLVVNSCDRKGCCQS